MSAAPIRTISASDIVCIRCICSPKPGHGRSSLARPPSTIGGLASDERPCPGFGEQMQRMQTMSDAEMVRIGAADMLPERGATTRARVNDALAAARGAYASATVRVGPGLGVTYDGSGQTRITYHRAPDYQFWVRFPSAESCPSLAAFVI